MSIKIDSNFILQYAFKGSICNINNRQCELLGLSFFTLGKGWIESLNIMNIEISENNAELFKLLHGVKGKRNQQLVIDNFNSKRYSEYVESVKDK